MSLITSPTQWFFERMQDLISGGSSPAQAFQTVQNEALADKRYLENTPIPIDYLQALVLIKILKNPEGIETLQKLYATKMESEAKIITGLAQSGAGNIIVAWAHSHIIAMILEHNYYIRKGGAQGLIDGMNWLTGAITLSEIVGNVAVPSVLAFSGVGGASATTRSLSALLGRK